MDVEVGSNLYRNTDGMIEIEGVPQIQVALKPHRRLLVNFAVFDANGKMTAKLIDSTLMINERRAYEVTKSPVSCHTDPRGIQERHLTDGSKKPDLVAFTKGGFIPSRATA